MGRVTLAEYPHHVVQRGHNRQTVFACRADYVRYLDDVQELKHELGVQVFAWCLMTNHVHLLVAPPTAPALGQFMKGLAGRSTRWRNRQEGRSGTLWEGRYKSSLVQTDAYLLACSRYIELNPVRAAMVGDPLEYAWSSCRERFGLVSSDILNWDPSYLALENNAADRRERYRAYLNTGAAPAELSLIHEALQRGQLTGNSRFIDEVAAIIGRRIEFRRQGRPRREEMSVSS